jgi:hypothetical protein
MSWLLGSTFTFILLAFFYVVPTTVEVLLLHHTGGAWVCILMGDLVGSLALIFLRNARYGVGVYCGLALVKYLVLHFSLITVTTLIWFSDLVPALVVCFLFFQYSRRDSSSTREMNRILS